MGYGLDLLLAPLVTFLRPRQYGYPLGPVPLLYFAVLGLVLARRASREIFSRILWADGQFRKVFLLALAQWLVWACIAPQGRYLTPVLAVQSVALVMMVAALKPTAFSPRLLHGGIAFVVLCQLGETLLCAYLPAPNLRNLFWSWPKIPDEITFQFRDPPP